MHSSREGHIIKLCRGIASPDISAQRIATERIEHLTKPRGSLGRLEGLAVRLAGIRGSIHISLRRKLVVVMAGDHGIVEEGVSAYPQQVTRQMVVNFANGGAAINVITRVVGASLAVVDIGVASSTRGLKHVEQSKVGAGTRNMRLVDAMTRRDAVQAISVGINIVIAAAKKGCDIIVPGEMGIGNTTAASAITAVICKRRVTDVTGPGTGLNKSQLCHKRTVIANVLKQRSPRADDPVGLIAKIGGYEIGGLTGVILAAAALRIPIVLDGVISTSAALIAATLAPEACHFMIAGHVSTEPAHRIQLKWLGLDPLLSLDMRLGEGTGAALSLPIIESAARMLSDMATFESAGVSTRDE